MIKVDCITVSVNYSDFLAWVIPQNKYLFDRWLIVTDTKDEETKRLCRYYDVECLQTDVFYCKGGFNKYAGINAGLEYLKPKDWVLFLDGDIVLPPITKRVFNELKLDKKKLYGIDRLNCKGFYKWIKYLTFPNLIIDNWLMTSAGFEFGSRINHYYGQEGDNGKFSGWTPLGFFQLAHNSAFLRYPDNCTSADHCDLVFAKQWIRENIENIPEIMAIHLEGKGVRKGINWNGRKTGKFSPKILEPNIICRFLDWIYDNFNDQKVLK